jgi:mono/diheme cytochrome c family protein
LHTNSRRDQPTVLLEIKPSSTHGVAMLRPDRTTIVRASLLALLCVRPAPAATAPAPTPEQVRFFETRVRPILVDHCFKCHGPTKTKSGLRLDTRAAVLAGGDSGPAVVPGNLDESLLVTAIRYEDDVLKMPPSKKLDREQIADLIHWVEMGAPWPKADQEAPAPSPSGTRKGAFQITDKDRAHWAFQPVRRAAAPNVKDEAWVRNPIDAFILARLDAQGLRPNPPAEKHELIRRATFDLTGLPPTLGEVEAFLADDSPTAYEALIDRLLASPHYGETWGRHWLDLVRFAETNSYERDNPKPNAWRYRDFVIRSLNQDKPYDRFVREQLAGDELPDGGIDGLIATGYYRLGIWDDEPTDRDQARYDGLDDIVATTSQVFLGLTVDCARCHDHKIDPIPQKDYYRILSFFQPINPYRNGGPTDEALIATDPASRQAFEQRTMERERQLKDLREAIAEIEAEFRLGLARRSVPTADSPSKAEIKGVDLAELIRTEGARVLGEQRFQRYRELNRRLESRSREKVAGDFALCVTETGPQAPATHVLLRGNPHVLGEPVEPAFLTVLNSPSPSIPTPPPGATTTGRRRVLADWIASPDNPLTARVMANRLWQYHFGRGIVRSPNNFGTQGDKPTHPELLDWLAAELVAQGWRLKPIHRLILTSNAYRMSTRGNAEALAQDPANDLFWRFDMRRLTGEEIRDAILAVTGTLNPKMDGPGVYPQIPAEVLAGQSMPGKGWGRSSPSEQARRSVYIHVKRSLLLPILESFDLAETDRSSPVRFSTTQPTQALAMLNGAFLNQQATRFADRLQREAGPDLEAQVRLAFRLATTREPRTDEVRRGLELIEAFCSHDSAGIDAGRKAFCLVVLNLNEFLYLD